MVDPSAELAVVFHYLCLVRSWFEKSFLVLQSPRYGREEEMQSCLVELNRNGSEKLETGNRLNQKF